MGEFSQAVTDSTFDKAVMQSELPVLVDFWAPWCGPCLAIGPSLEALAQEYEGRVTIAKMNVDENANVPAQFGVRSIPFLVMLKKGKIVDSQLGSAPKNRLKEMIEKSLT